MPTDVAEVPLRDPEAERAVLGAILLEPSIADDVAMVIDPECFADLDHQAIYRAILAVRDAGKRPDARMVIPELKRAKSWHTEMGPLLADIAESVPTASNAVYYAQQVRDWHIRRGLNELGIEIKSRAGDESTDAAELLEQVESKVFGLASQETRGEPVEIGSLVNITLDMGSRESKRGLETGYADLDVILSGLQPGELCILAARPSVGKSALAMNIAENVSVHRQQHTLIVSLEMSKEEISCRMICSIGRVDSWKFRNGMLGQEDHEMLVVAGSKMSQAPLWLDDAATRTASQIASVARRIQRRKGLDLLIVDYLQLISPEDKKSPRQEQVAAASRRLKGLARELKIPVLCLAQLNRQVEQTKARPMLSHLRESGAIEQDADVVMFLHRQPAKEEEMQSSEVECVVAKNRNGPIGVANLVWMRSYTRFETAQRRVNDPPPGHYKPYAEFENYQGEGF